MGHYLRALHNVRLIDLSVPISATTAEPGPPLIEYIDHYSGAKALASAATHIVRETHPSAAAITESFFENEIGLANENLQLDTHAGTHMDAPWHFGPLCENQRAKTIDEVPLEWCWGPGVVLDLRHKKSGDVITPEDLEFALARIHYTLKPNDIVLIMTGADKRFLEKDYFSAHAGMGREGTLWLLNQGIKVIGIDGWGFDRQANAMLDDYLSTGDRETILPAHRVGREREYCHIEKMANFDRIPVSHGFWVACFPVKVERGSAGWVRAVALVNKEEADDNIETRH